MKATRSARTKAVAARPAAVMGQRVRVRATSDGTYAHEPRRMGDVFELARPRDFDPRWMERLNT